MRVYRTMRGGQNQTHCIHRHRLKHHSTVSLYVLVMLMITFSSFNYVALLNIMLADVSTPRSRGGALWRPWYDRGRHGSSCFHDQQAYLLFIMIFSVCGVWEIISMWPKLSADRKFTLWHIIMYNTLSRIVPWVLPRKGMRKPLSWTQALTYYQHSLHMGWRTGSE